MTASSSLVARAEALARVAHAKQVRKGSGVPYITHPQAVAHLLVGCRDATQAAGWLHDVVEDTSYTLDDIRKECGDEVASIVAELTERKLDIHGNKRPWRIRKDEVIATVPGLSMAAANVRAADVVCNFNTVQEDFSRIGAAVWTRFTVSKEETLWYYKTMLRALIPRMLRLDLLFQVRNALYGLEKLMYRTSVP